MSRWNSPVHAYEFGHARTLRTDGEVWQIKVQESIGMPDGTLASFQTEIDDVIEGMEDVTVKFRPETDQEPAEIRVIGWRAIRDYEESLIPE